MNVDLFRDELGLWKSEMLRKKDCLKYLKEICSTSFRDPLLKNYHLSDFLSKRRLVEKLNVDL